MVNKVSKFFSVYWRVIQGGRFPYSYMHTIWQYNLLTIIPHYLRYQSFKSTQDPGY